MGKTLMKRWSSFEGAAEEYFAGDQDALIEYLLDDRKICWLRLGAAPVLEVPEANTDGGLLADPEQMSRWRRTVFSGYAMVWGAPLERLLVNGEGNIEWIFRKRDGEYRYMYLEPDKKGVQIKRTDLWVGRRSIEDLISSLDTSKAPSLDKEPTSTELRPIRSDREQNLLRVVAALWKLSELPLAPNTAADRISAILESWGWDGPKKGTIADRILKEAAALPGADLRKS